MALRIGERPFLFWCGLVLRGSRTGTVRAIPRAPRFPGFRYPLIAAAAGCGGNASGAPPIGASLATGSLSAVEGSISQQNLSRIASQFLWRKLRDGWHLFNHLLSPRIPERSRRVHIPIKDPRIAPAILEAKVTKDHTFLLNQTLSPRIPERSRRVRIPTSSFKNCIAILVAKVT